MDIDPIDFFPGYDPYFCLRQRRRCTITGCCTHMLAMAFAVSFCAGIFFYYEHYHILNEFNYSTENATQPKDGSKSINIDELKGEMEKLKEHMEKTNVWRKHLDELFTKIYMQQEDRIDEKVTQALDIYDADKIGLFDYASVYACGTIESTPETFAYPANKTISFFSLLTVDLLSNPDALLQPGNLPGNCFAFYGSSGKIRIKLGRKINVRAVTLDHTTMVDEASSAPKDFEVFGLADADDVFGDSLGKFSYKLGGRPYQTFKTNDSMSHRKYQYVELHILNNHGKQEFTCVYRFRVHNTFNKKRGK